MAADETLLLEIKAKIDQADTQIKALIKSFKDLNQEYKFFIDLQPKANQQAQQLNQTINNNNTTINKNTANLTQNNTAIQQNNLSLEQNNKTINKNTLHLEQTTNTTNKLTQELNLNTKVVNDNRVSLTENTKIVINYRESVQNITNSFEGYRNILGQVTTALFGFFGIMKAITTENAFIEYGRQIEVNFRNLNSIALETETNFQKIQASLLKFADKEALGGLDDLTQGLHKAYSSGYAGSDAFEVLKASAFGAGAGLNSTKQQLEATIAVLHSYGYEASKASEINNIFLKTIQDGVVELPEFSRYIGQAVTLAPQFKKANGEIAIGIEQVSAAIVGMTRQGLNMAESTTALNQLLKTFMDPAKEAVDLAKELQIELSPKAFRDGQTLADVIQDIIEKTNGIDQEELLGTLFGNIRALKGLFKLAKDDATFFKREIDALLSDNTAMTKALEQQRKTFDSHMNQLDRRWEVAMQSFFKVAKDMALPVVEFINKIVQAFNSMDENLKTAIAQLVVVGTGIAGLGAAGLTAVIGISALNTALGITATALGLTASQIGIVKLGLLGLAPEIAAIGLTATALYGIKEMVSSTKEAMENEKRNIIDKENSLKTVQGLLQKENELKKQGLQLSQEQNREMAVALRILSTNASTPEDAKRLREQAKIYEDAIKNHKTIEKKKSEISIAEIEARKKADEEYSKNQKEIETAISRIGKSEYEIKKQDLLQEKEERKKVLQDKINYGKLEAGEKEKLQKQLLDLDKYYLGEMSKLYKENQEKIKKEREQAQKEASDNFKKNIETQIKDLQASYLNKQNSQNTHKLGTSQFELFEMNKLKESNAILDQIKKKYSEIANSKIALPEMKAQAKKDYEETIKKQIQNIENYNKEYINRESKLEEDNHNKRLKNIEIEKAKKQKTSQEILQLEFNDLKEREAKLKTILSLEIKNKEQREKIAQDLANIQHQINLKAIEKQKEAQEQAIKEINKKIEQSKNKLKEIEFDKNYNGLEDNDAYLKERSELIKQKTSSIELFGKYTYAKDKENAEKQLEIAKETDRQIEILDKNREDNQIEIKKREIEQEAKTDEYLLKLKKISEEEMFNKTQERYEKEIQIIKNQLSHFKGSKKEKEDLINKLDALEKEKEINKTEREKKVLNDRYNSFVDTINSISEVGRIFQSSSNETLSALGQNIEKTTQNMSKSASIAMNVMRVTSGDMTAAPALISEASSEIANSIVKATNSLDKLKIATSKGVEGFNDIIDAGEELIGAIPLVGSTIENGLRGITDSFNLTKPKQEVESFKNSLNETLNSFKEFADNLINSPVIKANLELSAINIEENQKISEIDKKITEKEAGDTKLLEAEKLNIITSYMLKRASIQKKLSDEQKKQDKEVSSIKIDLIKDEERKIEELHKLNLNAIEDVVDNEQVKIIRIQQENMRYNQEKLDFEYKYSKLKAENLDNEKEKLLVLYSIDVERAKATIGNEKILNETLISLKKKFNDDLLKLDKKLLEDQKKLKDEEKEIVKDMVDLETDAMNEYYDKLIQAQEDTTNNLQKQIDSAQKKLEAFKEKMNEKSEDLNAINLQFNQQKNSMINKLALTGFFDYSTAGFDDYQARTRSNIQNQYDTGSMLDSSGKPDQAKLNQLLQEQALKEQIYYQYKSDQAIPNSELQFEYQEKSRKAYKEYVEFYNKNIQLQIKKEEEIQQNKIKALEDEKEKAENNIKDLEDTQKKVIANIKRDYENLADAYQLALARANAIWHDDTSTKLKDLASKLKDIQNQMSPTGSTAQTQTQTPTSTSTKTGSGSIITNPTKTTTSTTSTNTGSGSIINNPNQTTSSSNASGISNPKVKQMIDLLAWNSPSYPYQYFVDKYGPLPYEELKEVIRIRGLDGYIPNFAAFKSGGVVSKPTIALMGEKEPEVVLNQSQIANANRLIDYVQNPTIKGNNTRNIYLTANFTGQISANNTNDLDKIANYLKKEVNKQL